MDSSTLSTFVKFMADKDAWDMYISGAPGTGKTTELYHEVKHCMDNDIPYMVCAYTHRACEILRSKLPDGAELKTLHSFLKKRPTINQHATDIKHIDHNSKNGKPERPLVLLLDEYSMIGEKDGLDILAEQDPEYSGGPAMKVVWLGDKHQIRPVGDVAYVKPGGDYNVTLTKQWRNPNELQVPIGELTAMIDGAPLKPLTANKRFIRGKDIVKEYKASESKNKVILAYTNQCVEELNCKAQGYKKPKDQDILFSPTTKQQYKFLGFVKDPDYVDTPFSGEIHKDSKYKTLEYLIKTKSCKFAEVEDGDGNILTIAFTFGHYQSKIKIEELKSKAAKSNRDIETKHRGYKAAAWAKNNAKTKLGRARSKAWRDFLSYDECVICLDFNHATTVHKSQGSTFEEVFLDTEDIYKCANINLGQYLELMLVGLSRAQKYVTTN